MKKLRDNSVLIFAFLSVVAFSAGAIAKLAVENNKLRRHMATHECPKQIQETCTKYHPKVL